MNKILTTFVSGSLLLSAGLAIADGHEGDKPTFRPVETWTCDYNEGKGPDDLEEVNAEWNDWMDDENQNDYFAALVTPQYYGEWPFDVAWLGVWRDGNAMGTGTDLWLTEGGEIGAAYGEVVNCKSHTNFASQRVRAPQPNDDESDNTFVLTFSNCSIKDGKSYEDFMAAQEAWNAYADEHGIMEGNWVWWPIFGESDNDYDFKYVAGMDDHTQTGANWQKYSEGHYAKSSELFDGILDCDIGRMYDARVVREMADED